jgi:transcriptional regulator with XRE-family HTH domain
MQDWKRLATYAVSRRAELGYTSQGAFAQKVGVSKRTINGFERGESKLQPANLARLEQALQWEPGSASAVLAGGVPNPTAGRPPSGELTPERAMSTLLEDIMKVRRAFGDDAARAFVEGAFARPVEPEAAPERSSDDQEATG